MKALRPLRWLADHSLSGPINRSMKYMQDQDDQNELGQRSMVFTKNGAVLDGFAFNRDTIFENVVRTPLKYSISRESLSATINIPELLPGLNFFPPEKYAVFSVMAQLGVVPNLYWTNNGYKPSHPEYRSWTASAATPWLLLKQSSPPAAPELKLDQVPPDDNFVLMLSIGVGYGAANVQGIQDVKHRGCGKVLAVC